MAQILSCSIDLSKVDKSKIIEGKNGAKYYNFDVIINDEPDKFGKDVAITQQQTKDERKDKVKKVYIGNGKSVWKSQPKVTSEEQPTYGTTTRDGITTADDESLPF